MSKVVPAPQVWNVAVPDAAGVQTKTCSGALEVAVAAHGPLSAPAPEVVPVKVPPPGGMTIGLAHVPAGTVVVVVLGSRTVVVVVCGTRVVLVVDVLEVVDVDVLVEVDVLLDVEVVLVVVGGASGGLTVSVKLPLPPAQEPAKPSTTMTYDCPAVTAKVPREPKREALQALLPTAQPVLSSLQVTLEPVQVSLRT